MSERPKLPEQSGAKPAEKKYPTNDSQIRGTRLIRPPKNLNVGDVVSCDMGKMGIRSGRIAEINESYVLVQILDSDPFGHPVYFSWKDCVINASV